MASEADVGVAVGVGRPEIVTGFDIPAVVVTVPSGNAIVREVVVSVVDDPTSSAVSPQASWIRVSPGGAQDEGRVGEGVPNAGSAPGSTLAVCPASTRMVDPSPETSTVPSVTLTIVI